MKLKTGIAKVLVLQPVAFFWSCVCFVSFLRGTRERSVNEVSSKLLYTSGVAVKAVSESTAVERFSRVSLKYLMLQCNGIFCFTCLPSNRTFVMTV